MLGKGSTPDLHIQAVLWNIFYHEYSLTDIRMVMWILLKIEGALGVEG